MKSPSAPAAKPEGKSSKSRTADTNTATPASSPATTPPSSQTASTSANGSQPSHEEISKLAAQIYKDGGCVEGRDAENWLKAEQTLRQKAAGKK